MTNNNSNPRVELVGPPGAGKSTLLRLLSSKGAGAASMLLGDREAMNRGADALIFACPADLDPNTLRTNLEPIAAQLNRLAKERGQDCEVAALPVFLVLTKCDLLARPDDTLGDWLERIEAGKQQAQQALGSRLTNGNGFGTPALHYWATAQQRPVLAGAPLAAQDPFGVTELQQQATAAAREYRRRRQRQPRWVYGLIALTGGLLLVLALATAAWAMLNPLQRDTTPPVAAQPWPEGDYLIQGKETLADAQKLLRFEEYRPGSPATTEWPRWHRDAQIIVNDLKEVRERLAAEKIGQSLSTELQAVERELTAVQERAALFGLAGELPSRPAVLHFPAEPLPYENLRRQVQERLDKLARHYPTFAVEPLPALVPLGVAAELHAAAQVSYDKLLTPVQTEIKARVLKLGEGRETPRAWVELADGWLSVQAESELFEWRELAVLLERLTGQAQPADPLTQLSGFVRQESIALPLERIELHLPTSLKIQGETFTGLKPVDAPLVITRRTEAGETTTLNLLPLTGRTLPGDPDRYQFGVARQNPLVHGRLIFKPGDDITARLKIVDDQGKRWVLSWPLADSRSLAWSFSVLNQAPRLHREEEAALKGTIAFPVRLIFSEPSLFELPDLMPR